jgi:hypothetical protein
MPKAAGQPAAFFFPENGIGDSRQSLPGELIIVM